MLGQLFQPFLHQAWRQSFLFVCTLITIFLWSPAAAVGQTQLAGVCPAACGIKIRITSANLTEANDGMLVNVEWTLEQTAPEIKLRSIQVFARVKLGIDKVENTVNVSSTARQATLKLSRRFEFDFKDVEDLTTKVTALADALPSTPVTNITSRKIVGSGGDSAVEVTWGNPGPLPCSANVFDVRVAATNEKGDRLTGVTTAPPSARSARAEVKGDVNKKGLHNPEATVKLLNSLIECPETKFNSSPVAAVPRDNSGQTKVTLKKITFQEGGGRIDSLVDWEVVEPSGFKATKFDLKFEIEEPAGKIIVNNRTASGDQRSLVGPQVQTGGLRSLTVTITATFRDNANTTVLTREDKKTQAFSVKGAIKPVAEIAPAGSKPTPPDNTPVKLEVTNLKVASASNLHRVTSVWQLQLPQGVTVLGFELETTVAGTQNKVNRSAVFPGNSRQGEVNFSFSEVGNQVKGAQVKVTANLKRADGRTFQQTATRKD